VISFLAVVDCLQQATDEDSFVLPYCLDFVLVFTVCLGVAMCHGTDNASRLDDLKSLLLSDDVHVKLLVNL